MSRTPPPPLEWHPYYRNRTWLIDWLEGRGPYANNPTLRIPVLPSMATLMRSALRGEPEPDLVPMPRTLTLTRSRAVGLAPHVGRPFVYEWQVATDDLGREIASDSRIVYTDQQPPTSGE
jgi:hypothetical protein